MNHLVMTCSNEDNYVIRIDFKKFISLEAHLSIFNSP